MIQGDTGPCIEGDPSYFTSYPATQWMYPVGLKSMIELAQEKELRGSKLAKGNFVVCFGLSDSAQCFWCHNLKFKHNRDLFRPKCVTIFAPLSKRKRKRSLQVWDQHWTMSPWQALHRLFLYPWLCKLPLPRNPLTSFRIGIQTPFNMVVPSLDLEKSSCTTDC